jgi:hypothetical protein
LVSLHRSEGFGLTIAEAMYLKKRGARRSGAAHDDLDVYRRELKRGQSPPDYDNHE